MKHQRRSPNRTAASRKSILRRWLGNPVTRFLFRFLAFTCLLFGLSLLPFADRVVQHLVLLDATCSRILLNLAGETTRLQGTTFLGRNGITVLPACSALEYVCFLSAALLAFPAPAMKKAIGIAAGSLALLLVNLTRIITLQLASVHFPRAFPFIHEELWSILLVSLILFFYVTWMRWVQRDFHAIP